MRYQEGESLLKKPGYLPVAPCKALIVIAMADILILEIIEDRPDVAFLDDVQALIHILNVIYVHRSSFLVSGAGSAMQEMRLL